MQAATILNLTQPQLRKLAIKESVRFLKLGRQQWYNREDINYLGGFTGQLPEYNIDLNVWVPFAEIKSYWPYSREYFYQNCQKRGNDNIDAQEVNGMWLFFKKDIKDFIFSAKRLPILNRDLAEKVIAW